MLFSHRFKIPGILLVAAGLFLGILYLFVDLRFEVPVLAIISSYMETRFFEVFKTNFADETILLLLISGLFMMAFSTEKEEGQWLREIRMRALTTMLIVDTGFLLFSLIFFYGGGFLVLMMLQMILPLALYLLFFYGMKARKKRHRP